MTLTVQMMRAFDDELEKTGAAADLLRQGAGFMRSRAGATGALTGAGAALGGLGGAGVSGIQGYREARSFGATKGQAVMYATSRGLQGAKRGALIGGAVGAAGGLAGGARAAELGSKITGKGLAGAPSRFVQRQVHSLSGYASPEQVRAMRGGAWDAAQRATGAKKGLESALAETDLFRAGSNAPANIKKITSAMADKARASRGLQAAEKAEKMGLTSVPGYLKSFADNPMETLRAGVAEQWRGSGAGGKAALIGLPASGAVLGAAAPTEEGGPGRVERGLKGLGRGLGYSLAPIPIAGQLALEKGLGGAGGLVGAGADSMLSRKKRKQLGNLAEAQAGPEDELAPHAQTYHTPAALGKAPEGVG
jgi:hypothetical protein